MLASLSVRDILLIEALDLDLDAGLVALTGETGAGKSIILDALGLALGARADRALVRQGAAQGSVSARFQLPPAHAVHALLEELGPEDGHELILRRTLAQDGRSRAFVNDAPVSTGLLRRLAGSLVEIHGQMDQQGLLDPKTHRQILDSFGDHLDLAASVREAHAAWRALQRALDEKKAALESARREEDYLRHRLEELQDLAPEAGEEDALADRRALLMNREKLLQALRDALEQVGGQAGALHVLGAAQRKLERVATQADGLLDEGLKALDRAAIEAEEAQSELEKALQSLAEGDSDLAALEDRLFALREAARKHRVRADELPDLLEATREALESIDSDVAVLEGMQRETELARQRWLAEARRLSEARQAAASRLAEAVALELPALKLERAALRVMIVPEEESRAGAEGLERVEFEVQTNPDQPFGALSKIASGGELSRLMLAFKVVLAGGYDALTLIFDEVDTGIGGATAAAVGERLARLARDRQVMVVTHAPQVAARASYHLNVIKTVGDGKTMVNVVPLEATTRRDEIARMLSGAAVTEAARAAAASLIDGDA